jgi:hypothetical protein
MRIGRVAPWLDAVLTLLCFSACTSHLGHGVVFASHSKQLLLPL